ncbi:MAG: hypothetical protein IJY62_00820 [Clostridia bacterium]|nr:hypothetical protein [Clostridia bacterium]
MKRRNKLIALFASLSIAALVGACSTAEAKKVGDTNEYKWAYAPSMSDECDEDMKIDGVLDEARWQGQKQLVHTEKGVTMTYTTIFTEKGLYIGATAKDKEIGWTGRLRYEENSCFWFSVKGEDIDTNLMKGTEVFNFYVDGENASSFNHARYQAKGKTDKAYDEDPTELTAELFVTWDAINVELGENGELPSFVRINPHYRYIGGMDRDTWLNPLLFFDNNDRQQCSGRFGAVGYINADKEGAVVGNAANGHSKSDGWDLTRIDEGIVSSDVDHAQGIFFTGVCSDIYTYSVTVDVKDETVNGKMGQVGVFDAIDEISFNAFFLNQPSLLKKDYSKYSTLSLYGTGFGGWSWIDAGMILPEYNDGDHKVTYTVVKDGAYFYYIVNDVFVMSKYIEYLSGESCPGLFALDCVAEFTDYSATDLSAEPQKVDEILQDYGVYRVKKPENISGGSIGFMESAIVSGEDAVMTITPANGFILTDLTINGEDKYDEVVAGLEKGKYTLENVTQTMEIVPMFTRIPESVSVTGKILVAGTTAPVLNATATLWGSNPLLYYSSAATSNGTYNFRVPKAGTQSIGGREFVFDGAYSFKAKAGGYLSVNDSFSITESETRNKNYEMSAPVYDAKTWYVVGEEGVYTPSGSNYYQSSYAYTSEQSSDTVVYSVKINAPLGLVGYRGQLPNVGVTITDGTIIDGTWKNDTSVSLVGEYFATRVGLSNCGVVSHMGSVAVMARRLDRPVADRWNFSTVNDAAAFASSDTERTLTVAILEHVLYIYVDGVYITDVSLLNTNYFTANNHAFTKDSKYTLGVNTTNIDHVANPVTFEVLTEAYGDDAIELIQTEEMFEEARVALEPVTSRNMSVNEGVYTLTSDAHGLPWGYGGEAFYYTSEASNVVLYSVKATLTKELVGYTNPFDGKSADYVGYANIGIFITDGNVYEGTFGFSKRTSNYIHIGMSELGLVASSMGEMRRRLDVDFGSRWSVVAAANNACGFTAGITERTLTIALYQGVMYIYVDGVYIVKYALNDSSYFATTHFLFDANTQLKFGVGTEFVDSDVTPVSFTVEKQLTGDAALNELKTNELYVENIFKIKSNGVTTNADGSYALGAGWMNYSYAYTTKTPTDTAVYSVQFTTANDLYGEGWFGHTGIIFSNGEVMGSSTWTDANKGSSGRVCNEYFLSGALIGFCGQAAAGSNKYLSLTSGILSKWNERYYNFNTTAAFTDKTLTLVLYGGMFYVYVDNAYVTSVSLDNDAFDYTNNSGVAKNITSSDKLIFGVASVNSKVAATAKIVNSLQDSAALDYIKANYSDNITVS